MGTRVVGVVLVGVLCGGWLSGADEKPAPAKGYELRIVAVGDSYHGIRFKPDTGESWNLLNGRWEKLDAAPPPAGDYDVTIIPAESLLALRLDRTSGATWLLRKGKWNAVKEPPAPADAPAPKPRAAGFAMRYVTVGDQLHVVRFHAKTGETWHLKGESFEPLAEFGKVAAGEFDLTMIASKRDWMAFRIDRKAGTTWLLQANIWQEVTEP